MRVLGTAGHVDHGKSSLVKALTGIDPDRLPEEKARQMTIDLGFAWLTMPDGEEVGIVDVPGHRDFIENMLAGVGGIDAALLVIAADEGVMPQTKEHLAILDLLQVDRGVLALTKTDLVTDEGWLELVREEVRQLVKPTALAEAPVLLVSSVTRAGLDALVEALGQVLRQSRPRPDLLKPRLPIDRAFTIAGFGTVVTGTLLDGSLQTGEEIEVLPSGVRGRIRGLQTHKTKVATATPGSRTAVNITGLEVADLARGDVLVRPGAYATTRLIDVRFRLLPDAERPVKHDQALKIFLGAAQRLARVRLLQDQSLLPGEEGWLQLVLDRPVVAARGDRFILRRPSPGSTLGGGQVVDPHPDRRYRRRDSRVHVRLQGLLSGSPAQVLAHSLIARGPSTLKEALQRAGVSDELAGAAIEELRAGGELLVLDVRGKELGGDSLVIHRSTWVAWIERVEAVLAAYHRTNPIRLGMPREELKSRLGLDGRTFSAVMEAMSNKGLLREQSGKVAHPGHEVVLGPQESMRLAALRRQFQESPFAPPSLKQCREAVGEEVCAYLVESGQWVQLSPEVVLEKGAYEQMVEYVRTALEQDAKITVADVRDRFETSRKYALALLEHLDDRGLTVREGDFRRLSQKSASLG